MSKFEIKGSLDPNKVFIDAVDLLKIRGGAGQISKNLTSEDLELLFSWGKGHLLNQDDFKRIRMCRTPGYNSDCKFNSCNGCYTCSEYR